MQEAFEGFPQINQQSIEAGTIIFIFCPICQSLLYVGVTIHDTALL